MGGGISNLNVHGNRIQYLSSLILYIGCVHFIHVQSFCNKQLIETMNRTVCFVCRKGAGTGEENV